MVFASGKKDSEFIANQMKIIFLQYPFFFIIHYLLYTLNLYQSETMIYRNFLDA